MGKRMTATEKWDKEWFMNLTPKLKCLWIYLNDKCDQAGMWEINYRLASMHIGETISENDISVFGSRVEKFGPGKIWIVDHVAFQCGTLSDKSPAHKPIFNLLKKYTLLNRVLSRVSNTLQETEQEKGNRTGQGNGQGERQGQGTPAELEDYDRWTLQITEGNDQRFEQMFMKEAIPASDNIQFWVMDHRDLLNRYPKMRPPTQDAFRKSCIKHIRDNYKKPINGTSKDRRQANTDSLKEALANDIRTEFGGR